MGHNRRIMYDGEQQGLHMDLGKTIFFVCLFVFCLLFVSCLLFFLNFFNTSKLILDKKRFRRGVRESGRGCGQQGLDEHNITAVEVLLF